MVYWHLDKDRDLAQFDEFRRQKRAIEEAYLKLRTELREAEAVRRAEPGNAALQERVEDLQKQLRELEQQAPWLTAEVPVEMALWGTTSGLL